MLFLYFQERTMQAKVLELEGQLSQLRSEISKLKREKDEVCYFTYSLDLLSIKTTNNFY